MPNERNHKPLVLSANQGMTESVAYLGEPGPYNSSRLPFLDIFFESVGPFREFCCPKSSHLNLDIKELNN